MRALLVYPTHANCHEVADDLESIGIRAVCYPKRLATPTKDEPENCWNKDADRAEQFGLSVQKSVCLACKESVKCKSEGYLARLREATEADVALATHKRAASSGLAELARDSMYVAIHENAVEMLRPTCRIEEPELLVFRRVVNDLVNDPSWLDWFGSDLAKDEDGNEIHDEEQKVQRERLFDAAVTLVKLLESLSAAIQQSEVTTAWAPPDPIQIPPRFQRLLFKALCQAKARFGAQVCQFALAALAGELASAAIMVNEVFSDQSQGPAKRKTKVALGVRCNDVPTGRTVWFCDSTANPERLSRIIGLPVFDRTPDGTVPLQKKAIQYLRDLTQSASPEVAASILRGTLALYSDRKRVGVITHRSLLGGLNRLSRDLRSRIVATTYYHSGQDRSSNSWHEQCDLLLILGTPRVPPSAVAEYLVQVGELEAACTEPAWGTMYWYGEIGHGPPIRIEGRGYQDGAWRTAHRDLVRSSIVQAVGRGRGILETGCDVLVFSNEECGLEIAPDPCPWMNEQSAAVYQAVRELTDTKSKKHILEKVSVSSVEVAEHLRLVERTARRCLIELEQLGLLERLGPRSGWALRVTASGFKADCLPIERAESTRAL